MDLGNLLESALTLLPTVSFSFRQNLGETVDEFGQKRRTYGEWIACRGMVQPVPRSAYADLGLDFAEKAINVWGSVPILTVGDEEDGGPSQILWNARLWNVNTVTEWNQYNGWVSIVAIQDRLWKGK